MSTVTDAFDAAAREFLKETWVKQEYDLSCAHCPHDVTQHIYAIVDPYLCSLRDCVGYSPGKKGEPWYPAEVVQFVEVEIDGVLMTFAVRIRLAKQS